MEKEAKKETKKETRGRKPTGRKDFMFFFRVKTLEKWKVEKLRADAKKSEKTMSEYIFSKCQI